MSETALQKCKISNENCSTGGGIVRGWCHTHYMRWYEHGDPLFVCDRTGGQNINWAGGVVGYSGRHIRLLQIRGKADHCIHRNAIGCTSTTYQWAQIHDTDGLDVYNYVPMCRSCHTRYDYKGGRARISPPSIRGNKHYRAELTEDIVAEVRSRPMVKGSVTTWAREFGVHYKTMKQAINGETWKHVPPAPTNVKEGLQL